MNISHPAFDFFFFFLEGFCSRSHIEQHFTFLGHTCQGILYLGDQIGKAKNIFAGCLSGIHPITAACAGSLCSIHPITVACFKIINPADGKCATLLWVVTLHHKQNSLQGEIDI